MWIKKWQTAHTAIPHKMGIRRSKVGTFIFIRFIDCFDVDIPYLNNRIPSKRKLYRIVSAIDTSCSLLLYPSGACTSACFRRQLSEGKRCGHSQANQTKRTIVWRQIQIHFVESTAILYLCISDTFHCFGQYSIVSLFWMQSAFTNICFLSHFVRGNKKQFPAKFLTMGTNSLLYSNILKERHVSRPKHLQNVYSKFDLFYLLWYW